MTDKPIKVLLIEDNPRDARLIEEMLSEVRGARSIRNVLTDCQRGCRA